MFMYNDYKLYRKGIIMRLNLILFLLIFPLVVKANFKSCKSLNLANPDNCANYCKENNTNMTYKNGAFGCESRPKKKQVKRGRVDYSSMGQDLKRFEKYISPDADKADCYTAEDCFRKAIKVRSEGKVSEEYLYHSKWCKLGSYSGCVNLKSLYERRNKNESQLKQQNFKKLSRSNKKESLKSNQKDYDRTRIEGDKIIFDSQTTFNFNNSSDYNVDQRFQNDFIKLDNSIQEAVASDCTSEGMGKLMMKPLSVRKNLSTEKEMGKIAKKCLCTSKVRNAYKVIDQILKRHPKWVDKEISLKYKDINKGIKVINTKDVNFLKNNQKKVCS